MPTEHEPAGTRGCEFCKARVVVLRDRDGKFQVLDVRAPVYGIGGDGRVYRMAEAYVSHWTTCTGREAAKAAQRERAG